MIRVDYTQLDQPQIRLTLVRTPTGWHSVIDQHGQLYFPPTQNLETCLRFMTAMARKKDALIDDASIERATWREAQQFSVRVDVLSERGKGATVLGGIATRGPDPSPMPRSESVSNVHPIRKAESA